MNSKIETPVMIFMPPAPPAPPAPTVAPRVQVDWPAWMARVERLQQQNEYLYSRLQAMENVCVLQNQLLEKLNKSVTDLDRRVEDTTNFVIRAMSTLHTEENPHDDEEEPSVAQGTSPHEHVARLRAQHGNGRHDDRDLTKKSGYGQDMEDSEE